MELRRRERQGGGLDDGPDRHGEREAIRHHLHGWEGRPTAPVDPAPLSERRARAGHVRVPREGCCRRETAEAADAPRLARAHAGTSRARERRPARLRPRDRQAVARGASRPRRHERYARKEDPSRGKGMDPLHRRRGQEGDRERSPQRPGPCDEDANRDVHRRVGPADPGRGRRASVPGPRGAARRARSTDLSWLIRGDGILNRENRVRSVMNGCSLREPVVRLKRDLFELILGIGILALGLVVILFTFSQAFAIATNPGPWLRNQLPQQQQSTGPSASFDWTSNDATVTFADSSGPGDAQIVVWDWDFGDGQRGSAQNPTHTYSSYTTYQASLVVRDANGKESLAVAQVITVVGDTRSGRGVNTPTGAGLNLNLDFAGVLLPIAIVFLTFGLFLVMTVAGGAIMRAGWNILKPKPETIRVRLKPKHLTQAFEDDSMPTPPPPAT